MNKAVFLDRDGTINTEVNYLYKPEDFVFIKGAVEAIKIFKSLGYKVIVITNQAGVARGYYTEADVKILHEFMDNLLEMKGTKIDAYYYCPHHPEGSMPNYAISCDCRKPNIKMIQDAVIALNIDLSKSIIIGDKELDVQTGKKAGIGQSILVRSGHSVDEINTVADAVYEDIYHYANELLTR